MLSSFTQHRTDRTAAGSQIDAVQTVEANRTFQKARAYIIHLMDFIHRLARQLRVFPPLRFIAPRPAMRQFMPTQNPVDRWQRRYWCNSQGLQFLPNSLGSTKQPLVIQTQTNQLNGLDNLVRNLPRVVARSTGLIFGPLHLLASSLISRHPFVDPTWRIPHGTSYSRHRLPTLIAFNGSNPISDLLSFHRWPPFPKRHRWSVISM